MIDSYFIIFPHLAILKVASSQYYPDSTRNINDGNFTLTSQSGKTLETISISYYESFEKIQWFKNNDDLISTNNSINTKFDNKYEVYVDSSNITLMIKNLSLEDSSNYTLEMKINEDYLTFNVELFVEGN